MDVELTAWEYNYVGQILHIGPFTEEWGTIQTMYEYVESEGYDVISESHEEIYLSDPRKTPSEKCVESLTT